MGKTRLGHRSRLFREFLGGVEPSALLIVAIDVSKFQPKAALFEYFGDIIIEPFFFTPDYRGINQLCEIAQNALLKTGKKKLLFGVENTGHYQETIFNLLIEKGQSVLQINAASTHEERKSLLDYSKTDDIDLHAIASAISGGKVTFNEVPTGLKAELRYLTRTRRFLVRERSKLIVMVRNLLDHYWPYLQGIPEIVDGKTQVKRIFEELNTPLFLRFIQSVSSPKEALAFGETGLIQLSKQLSFHFGLERIRLILRSAELSPPVDNIMLEHYVYHVKYHINGIICLNQEINNLEHQIERLFCQTRGVLLLSMHQVNVTTAAEFMAEVGLDIDRYHSASAIIS